MQHSERPLTERYDVALLDLDGVVYLGEQVIDGVPGALAEVRRVGMRLGFVTNNASRTPRQVAQLLERLGIPADVAEVITSSHAAAHYLADRLPAGAPVLVLGAEGLVEAVRERGLRPVASADDEPAAVVQGFSQDLGWRDFAEGMVAIGNGAFWLATNLDPTVPSPRGPLPGNGSLVAALAHATGRQPMATGKPEPTMHAESVQRSGARNPIVVGDRLDTDIEGARRADCASLLVLTGVTGPADLIAAPPNHRPDYLGGDVAALLRPQPPVSRNERAVRCGAATAAMRDGSVTLQLAAEGPGAHGDGLDALRALAVASWQALDSTGRVSQVQAGDDAAAAELGRLGLAGG